MFEEVIAQSRIRRAFNPSRARSLREQARLSQADVANALGVKPSAVCRWEKGERQPRGTIASNYAAMLEELAREVA